MGTPVTYFSLYILVIFSFLGLSKSFSLHEKKNSFVKNKQSLSRLLKGKPLSVISVDSFKTGLMIKSYYLKVIVIFPSHRYLLRSYVETRIIRVSKQYYGENIGHIGMSIFRRSDKKNVGESSIPMPPGSLYIGDTSYGKWVEHASGKKIWTFHKDYEHFPEWFRWDDFRPDVEFFRVLKMHMENQRPFYGLQKKFGTNKLMAVQQQKNSYLNETISKVKEYFGRLVFIPGISLIKSGGIKNE